LTLNPEVDLRTQALNPTRRIPGEQEADCKRGMNTFAFVGDLDKSPEVSCVYHSEAAENQYVRARV